LLGDESKTRKDLAEGLTAHGNVAECMKICRIISRLHAKTGQKSYDGQNK